MEITLKPIGHVVLGRIDPTDDHWDSEATIIEIDPSVVGKDALLGLDAFSHIEVIYWFHHDAAADPVMAARHPRGNPDLPKVGILAQRAKNRINRLGLTTCRLIKADGLRLEVSGLDAIAGTPILDIKPYMKGFAPRGAITEPEWASDLMRDYW